MSTVTVQVQLTNDAGQVVASETTSFEVNGPSPQIVNIKTTAKLTEGRQ